MKKLIRKYASTFTAAVFVFSTAFALTASAVHSEGTNCVSVDGEIICGPALEDSSDVLSVFSDMLDAKPTPIKDKSCLAITDPKDSTKAICGAGIGQPACAPLKDNQPLIGCGFTDPKSPTMQSCICQYKKPSTSPVGGGSPKG